MLTKESTEAFYRDWLKLLDSLAPPEAYRKYLVDGPFAEWSYPGKKIADQEALEAYAKATWGNIVEQSNTIESLDVTPGGDGTFTAVGNIHWQATMKGDQKVDRRFVFTVKLGSGTSKLDPAGEHPKVLRYTWQVA